MFEQYCIYTVPLRRHICPVKTPSNCPNALYWGYFQPLERPLESLRGFLDLARFLLGSGYFTTWHDICNASNLPYLHSYSIILLHTVTIYNTLEILILFYLLFSSHRFNGDAAQ